MEPLKNESSRIKYLVAAYLNEEEEEEVELLLDLKEHIDELRNSDISELEKI